MSYEVFIPPRRIEEYPDRVSGAVLQEVAVARLTHQPPKYLVKGEWTYADGRRELDIAVNREWVDATTNYRLQEDGRLRWTCPGCGKLSGVHTKVCEYR